MDGQQQPGGAQVEQGKGRCDEVGGGEIGGERVKEGGEEGYDGGFGDGF